MMSGSFVFGFPGETEAEYRQTMRFITELLDINPNMAFTTGWYLPYVGTGLYEKAKELGFKPFDKTEEWDKLDRWKNYFDLTWIGWDYRRAVKYSRKTIYLLVSAYRKNIPVLKQVLKWRIRHANFRLPLDILLISYMKTKWLAWRRRKMQKLTYG